MASKLGLGLVKNKEEVTKQSLTALFPKKKGTINNKTIDLINATINDPEFNGVDLVDTLTTYDSAMYKHSGKMEDYVNAVRFCAYLEGADDSNIGAYKKTFSTRPFVIQRADAAPGTPGYNELTSAASRFRKSPMVVDILTQADVPLYLMFQGFRYKAVKVLGEEMTTAPMARDRIAAADKLLTHVKPPENVQIEMDIGVKESSVIDDYEKVMAQMVAKQKDLITKGADLKEIANTSILVEPEDVIDVIEEEDSNV